MNEFLHILKDPAHWMFEAVSDAAFGLILSPIWTWAIRRHDRRKHV